MPPTLPNTLTNGTTADATQVMADLNAINAQVDKATVTSLPGSPYDGQEIYYVADATNGIVWHLKYRSASGSTYKWEYVGGPDLESTVSTSQSTTSGSYASLGTAGPAVTVPLAGDYDVDLGAHLWTSGAVGHIFMSADFTAAAADADGIEYGDAGGANTLGLVLREGRRVRKTGQTASTSFNAKYRVSNGGVVTGNFSNRVMRARPVRVG